MKKCAVHRTFFHSKTKEKKLNELRSACGLVFLPGTAQRDGYFCSPGDELRKDGGITDQYKPTPQQKIHDQALNLGIR